MTDVPRPDRRGRALAACLLAAVCFPGDGACREPACRLLRYSQTHGELRLDRSFTERPIKIAARSYDRGLGTHADSHVEIALSPACRTLTAHVGIDANAAQPGAAVFTVVVAGQALFRSELLCRGMEPVPVVVGLAGAKRLDLVVESAGGAVGDHADWADVRIGLADGRWVALSERFRDQGLPAKAPAWRRRAAKQCRVTDYAHCGDGETDAAPAFQRALNEVACAGSGVIHVPAGAYRLSRCVAAEMTAGAVSIMGDGVGVTRILCDSGQGGLRLHDETARCQFTVRDLSLLAVQADAGTALDVSSPPRGARNYRTLTVQNVDVRGLGVPSRHYFRCGIKAIGQWRPLFVNAVVSGVSDPALKGDQSDESPRYQLLCGIQADWCYAPSFQHCYVWSAHTGYRIVSEGEPEGPEDCAFYRCFAVGCRVGIDVSTPIPEPQLVIDSCHINCRDVGIRLHNRKLFHVTDNLLYGIDGEPARPYVDILITGRSFGGVVSGNIFHSPARHNYRAAPGVDRTMVRVAGQARDLLITGNIFNAKGVAIAVEPGARGIVRRDNHFANPQARR